MGGAWLKVALDHGASSHAAAVDSRSTQKGREK